MNYIDNPKSYQNPKISVVIPVYNGSNYLREAIDSVLNQTYKNYEIIVVDDGSTDDTWEIIQSYGDKVRGFKKENGGVSTALNYALDVMEGEWFAWLSHDDLWSNNKIERQIDFLKRNPDVDICYTGYDRVREHGELILGGGRNGCYYSDKARALRKLIEKDYISGITPLIPKICFQNVGLFRDDLRCVQDWDMWIRLMLNYHWGLLPERLVQSRVHQTQTGVKLSKRCKCEKHYLQKYYLSNKTLYPRYFPQYANSVFLNLIGNVYTLYVIIFVRLIKIFKGYLMGFLGKLLSERIKIPLRKLL